MATITVEVDIDDFDLDDILNHLDDLLEDGYVTEKHQINRWIERNNGFGDVNSIEQNISLFDKQKIDFFRDNFDAITLEDLENIVANKQK